MKTDPKYERALNKVLSALGITFEDLQYLKLEEFSHLPRVGRKLLDYTILKLDERGMTFGKNSITFLKKYLPEIRNLDALIIHDNDWGGYREEMLILDGGAALCGLSFPGDSDPEEHRDRAWLHDLSVLPEHRRKGLATKLVRICRQRAAAVNRRQLSLWVKPNSWQEKWYQRIGFVKDETLLREDGNIVYDLDLEEHQTDQSSERQ